MAHGFLRRVFEVFERHATSVDVVTTSEVSVSMTLDDDRGSRRSSATGGFASVQVERGMAIVSAVGDKLRADPAIAVRVIAALGRLPLRMVSQAASRRNVTVVLSDADVPAGDGPAARRILQMSGAQSMSAPLRVLLVGHGRMGRLVESLAPEYGIDGRGDVTSANASDPAAWPARRCRDRFLDGGRSRPANARAWRPWDLAGHRHDRLAGEEAALRGELGGMPIGVIAAPNFAIGVNLFLRSPSGRRGCSWRAGSRLDPRGPSRGEEGCAVGHRGGAAAGRRDARGARVDISSTRAGYIPGNSHGRLRLAGRNNHAHSHRP